jgi:hypothetical protein
MRQSVKMNNFHFLVPTIFCTVFWQRATIIRTSQIRLFSILLCQLNKAQHKSNHVAKTRSAIIRIRPYDFSAELNQFEKLVLRRLELRNCRFRHADNAFLMSCFSVITDCKCTCYSPVHEKPGHDYLYSVVSF